MVKFTLGESLLLHATATDPTTVKAAPMSLPTHAVVGVSLRGSSSTTWDSNLTLKVHPNEHGLLV